MKIRIKTIIMFAAVMMILAPTAVTVFAQPLGPGFGKERGFTRPFVEPLLMGHGFAMKGDEYHILDVTAIKTSDASPGLIRSLLMQKKSPEEIAKEINDAQTSTKMKAHLRFAGQAYALNITSYDDQSLSGNVLTIPPRGADQTSFTPASVGNISLLISKYEGEVVSTGTLNMNGTEYKVLMTSPAKLGRW